MAHQITIKEIVNGVEITETIDSNILISVLSYNAKPFFRSTNEEDVESFQIIDRIGEIYHLPALATEFTLIDINGNYFIPANGEELIEYSYKIRIFRPENEFDKVLNVGTVEATTNTVKVNISSVGLPNSVLINGSVYENYYPSLFNFVAVVEFTKILIVYAKPDSTVFYLAQGVEALSAVEPDYEGLFVARLIVNVSGIVIEEGGNNGDVLVKNGNSQEWSPRLTEAEQGISSALSTISGIQDELVTIESRLDDLDDNDNSLQEQITAETTARQNADIAESNARTFADGVLDGKITDEKNRNDSQDLEIATKLTKPTSPNNTSDRLLTADGGTTAKSNYQRNKQYFIPLPATVSEDWKGCLVFFTSSGTLTVPTGLTADFTFNGIVDNGVTLTPAITSPMAWLGTAPTAFSGVAIFTMVRRDGTNNFQILGV